MKLFPNETFFFKKKRLNWDIFLLLYFDLDNYWRPTSIIQCIQVWKHIPIPLRVPLLIFKFPIIDNLYSKKEFAYLINEQLDKNEIFLKRVWTLIWREIEKLIVWWDLYYKQAKDVNNKQDISEIYRRFIFLLKFLFWWDWSDDDNEWKKPP
jgi:hypothetical protein